MIGLRGTAFGPSIGERMAAYDNRSRGFDYLRLILSLGVLGWHSFFLTTNSPLPNPVGAFGVRMLLPMFFALSGFLVSGSLMRTRSIHGFLILRMLRIMPALAVVVAVSALILGPAMTTLPLRDYFASPIFLAYFRGMVGDIQYQLPGVFEHNPVVVINLSLWTVPFELKAYVIIAFLWLVRVLPRKRWLLLLFVAGWQVALPLKDYFQHALVVPAHDVLPGRVYTLSFLWAVVAYFFRDVIRLNAVVAAVCVGLAFVLLHSTIGSYFAALPAVYVTIFFGLTNPPRIPLLLSGDFSYGIYLIAAPIQQASIALFPAHRVWWFNILTALPVVMACAVLSWFVVERPMLARRRQIIGFVDRIIAGVVGTARGPRA